MPLSRAYVSPIFEVRAFDGDHALTVRYADDNPSSIQIEQAGGDSVFFAAAELPALIDALRRIGRDCKRDEAEVERPERPRRTAQ